MSGFAITVDATLQCPHGGKVAIISTNTSTMAGTAIATGADQFVITGCPFQLPGPVPSPCVKVQWMVPDVKTTVKGSPTVSAGSVGMCLSAAQIPQGPVIVASTQQKVSTS
jgi:hypothetical protein